MAENPIERPLAVKLLFARLREVRLAALIDQRDTFGLNEVNLFPERSRVVRAVMPVPVNEVSLLFEKVNEVTRVFPLILRVVRAGRFVPINPVLRPFVARVLFEILRFVRLDGLPSMVDASNDISLFPERLRVVRAVMPVPLNVVSLLLVKVNVFTRIFSLISRVVRAGR